MKCIISIGNGMCPWINKIQVGVSPYLLKIVNKPWGEYLVDFCFSAGVREIKMLIDDSGYEVENYFSDGGKWGVAISYGFERYGDSLKDLMEKNSEFIGDSDILLITGPVFAEYSVKHGKYPFFDGRNIGLSCADGRCELSIFSAGGRDLPLEPTSCAKAGFGIRPLLSIKDYFDLNAEILREKRGDYVLPGYNNEDGIHLGQNVAISRTARIEKPVMIGDNVEIGAMSVIGPGVVIGSNVIIDNRTVVANSIICDGSYVGQDLDIENRIVRHSHLIDPETGELLAFHDDFILSGDAMPDVLVKLKWLRSIIGASVILLFLLPLYIPMILLLKLSGKLKPKSFQYLAPDRKTCCTLRGYDIGTGVLPALFKRLSLNKFAYLLEALKGNMYIAGNYPAGTDENGQNTLQELPRYYPAVFSYGDSLPELPGGGDERLIHDLYYSYNSSFLLDIKIVIASVFRRLCG
ncbi:MAG: hypothetical protein WCP55_04735 [Lentisphaerota bacterium]